MNDKLRPRETEFYVGAHASPFGVHMQLTLASCLDALVKYRLGNFFTCNGNELGHITGASQQDLITDTNNAAVQVGLACARRGIHFAFISVDFADRGIVEFLNEHCGAWFLGPLKGETSGLPASIWHADSRHINDENRHLNHNPPPCFAKDMQDAKDTYLRFLKERFADRYRAQGVRRTIALDQNGFHRFDLEAGFDIPVNELMTQRVQPDLACLRGAAAAFGKSLWGTWIAIGWYGGSNYDPLKPLRWRVCLHAAYMHGSRIFVQESGHLGVHDYGDRNTLGVDHPLSKKFRTILANFSRFTQTHVRPKGNPVVSTAFLQGRHDGWSGSRLSTRPGKEWVWGQKDSGDHWKEGEPERGWDLLDIVYPRIQQERIATLDHFSGAPFGQVDLAPADAPLEALTRYRCLIMPAWNTMSESMYRNLTAYVRGGGTLFAGVPQFNTDPDRSHPWSLIHGGNLRDLCGVHIRGPEEKPGGYLGSWTGSAALAVMARRSVCGLPVRSRFLLHSPRKLCRLSLCGAEAVAVSNEGFPVLLEHKLGKGTVLLLALWSWPGEWALRAFVGAIVEGLLRRFNRPVRIRGTECVDWTEYKWNDTCSNIYLLNVSLRHRETGVLTIGRRLEVPFALEPGEFRVLYKFGDRVYWADDSRLVMSPDLTGRGRLVIDPTTLKKPFPLLHIADGNGVRSASLHPRTAPSGMGVRFGK